MRKIAKSWAVAKQAALEKMGKAEVHIDKEEANIAKESVLKIKKSEKEVLDQCIITCNEGATLHMAQSEVFANLMLSYSSVLKDMTPQANNVPLSTPQYIHTPLGDLSLILSRVGGAQRVVNQSLDICTKTIHNQTLRTVKCGMEDEVKRLNDMHGQQQTARLAYEASLNALNTEIHLANTHTNNGHNTVSKQQTLEGEKDMARKNFENLTHEFLAGVENFKTKTSKDMKTFLKNYLEAQLQYFSDGLNAWKDVEILLTNFETPSSTLMMESTEEGSDGTNSPPSSKQLFRRTASSPTDIPRKGSTATIPEFLFSNFDGKNLASSKSLSPRQKTEPIPEASSLPSSPKPSPVVTEMRRVHSGLSLLSVSNAKSFFQTRSNSSHSLLPVHDASKSNLHPNANPKTLHPLSLSNDSPFRESNSDGTVLVWNGQDDALSHNSHNSDAEDSNEPTHSKDVDDFEGEEIPL
eukprot:TRINITY_DN5757_c0_g1_i1.p1 TRINITY_DN5757_c0_g1~~TRINITY_DN5757_c0_g1_i1.p1  ORF type:complete len:466 (-),score=96.90 TRINITY_DN5757_c0_g1_i1:75-1472(-)